MTSATTAQPAPTVRRARRFNRWDSPWLNSKLIIGSAMILFVILLGLVGPLFWDVTMSRVASAELNIPPLFGPVPERGFPARDPAHPLGTESNGRDMLALMMSAAPGSLRVGLIAASIGMGVGIILGFTAGYLGGWWDAFIRTIADSVIVIPSLAVLIVISAYVRQVNIENMALLIALFLWPGPTRLIRSQVLSLRERGYVLMARLSGASTFDIMFKEMLPNMLPWLAASFTANVSAAILAAAGLEALGLGPTRVPTLGMTIFYAIRAAAILRGMWWWWGFPIVMLILIFSGLFMITIGLDEIANPRLRGLKSS
jgi:peptide/nickel transport system permease protein